jgi:hypothetical protein
MPPEPQRPAFRFTGKGSPQRIANTSSMGYADIVRAFFLEFQ